MGQRASAGQYGRIWSRSGAATSARMAIAALLMLAGALVWTTVAAATQPGETYEQVVRASGPVAYFPFADASGSTEVKDVVGSYTAEDHGIALGEPGPFGGSRSGLVAELGGGEKYATLPSDPLAGAKEFTAEAWVNWKKEPFYGEGIFWFIANENDYLLLTPGAPGSGHKMTFEIHSGSATSSVTATKLGQGAWHYVAVTETAAGTISLYVDGEQVAQSTGQTLSPASVEDATEDYLGQARMDGIRQSLQGNLSNVAFYTKALSKEQIAEHYDAAEFPVNTTVPTISGTTKEGKTLKVKEGSWNGETPIAYTYEWERCYESVCKTVAGAKTKEYALTSHDVGYKLRVLVAAKNSAGSGEALSADTETVTGTGLAPTNTEAPKVEGVTREGQTLTASSGEWEGTPPFSYQYQWERCNSLGEGCLPVSGATSKTYVLGAADVASTLRVKVTAKGDVEPPASATSSLTPVIEGTPPVNTQPPKIEGEAREGQTVTATTGKWSGTEPITYTNYAWLHCKENVCHQIEGASGKEDSSYKLTGAYVGETIEVEVTAKNSVGSASATSAGVLVSGNKPVDTELPVITGTPEEGKALTATVGKWEGSPTSYEYRWESCSDFADEEASCVPISGATEASFTPAAEVVQHKLRVTVTATNSAGSESVASADTGEVVPRMGVAAVGWGLNDAEDALGAGYADHWEPGPVSVVGLAGPGESPEVRSMVSAFTKSYALLNVKGGVVRAWGAATEGGLGDGMSSRESPTAPVPVVEKTNGEETKEITKETTRELTDVIAITAAKGAFAHAMALVNAPGREGEVMTWGASGLGERGNGEYDEEASAHARVSRDAAIPVPGLKHVIAIATGGNSDYALQEEDGKTEVWAWGENEHGRLGIGTENGGSVEGEQETLKCLSDGSTGKNKNAFKPCWPNPQKVDVEKVVLPPNVEVTAIAAGKQSAYALLSDGRVLAWGENDYGQLGDGSLKNSETPRWVCAAGYAGECSNEDEQLKGVSAISAGESFALALLDTGEVVGWGDNRTSELGGTSDEECENKSMVCRKTPKTVNVKEEENPLREKPLSGVTEIAAGSEYSVALNTEGKVYSWGANEDGQLGDGSAEGPEKSCGRRSTVNGSERHLAFEIRCSKWPAEVNGLSEVAGIAAVDGAQSSSGLYGHSFAWLREGAKPPAPLLTVAAPVEEKDGGEQIPTLKVTWQLSSPTGEYRLKWKEAPPSDNENLKMAEEANENGEDLWGEVSELVGEEAALLAEAEKAYGKAENQAESRRKTAEKKEAEASTKREAAAAAEKAGNSKEAATDRKEAENDEDAAKEDSREQAEYENDAKEIKEKQITPLDDKIEELLTPVKEYGEKASLYEELLGEEFPRSKEVAIEANCAEKACNETVREAEYGEEVEGKWEKKSGRLNPEGTYEVTVNRIGYKKTQLEEKVEEKAKLEGEELTKEEKTRRAEEAEETEEAGSATITATVPQQGG